MSSDEEAAAGCLVGCVMLVLLSAVSGLVCGFALDYTINFWLVYAHKSNHWPWVAGFLIGAVPLVGTRLCLFAILATVGTFIASFFL